MPHILQWYNSSGSFCFQFCYSNKRYGWWVGEDDITEFAFTPQQYIEAMDDNLDSNDGYQVWRTLWASGGNYGGYEITTAAMQDPASLSVEFRKENEASLEDLASLTLGCIQNCYSSRSFNAYLSDAIAKIEQQIETILLCQENHPLRSQVLVLKHRHRRVPTETI